MKLFAYKGNSCAWTRTTEVKKVLPTFRSVKKVWRTHMQHIKNINIMVACITNNVVVKRNLRLAKEKSKKKLN